MQHAVQIAADESISFKMSVSHAHTFSAGLLESFQKGVFKCEAPWQTDIYSLNLHVSPPAELKTLTHLQITLVLYIFVFLLFFDLLYIFSFPHEKKILCVFHSVILAIPSFPSQRTFFPPFELSQIHL